MPIFGGSQSVVGGPRAQSSVSGVVYNVKVSGTVGLLMTCAECNLIILSNIII